MTEHEIDYKKTSLYKMFDREAKEGRLYGKCERCNKDAFASMMPWQEIKFCTRCGDKLVFYKRTKSCSKGHMVEQSWDFCGVCGSPVDMKEERVP